jgi:hypothetical protein
MATGANVDWGEATLKRADRGVHVWASLARALGFHAPTCMHYALVVASFFFLLPPGAYSTGISINNTHVVPPSTFNRRGLLPNCTAPPRGTGPGFAAAVQEIARAWCKEQRRRRRVRHSWPCAPPCLFHLDCTAGRSQPLSSIPTNEPKSSLF